MSEKFSATLRIGDLNDYIAPSQGCVVSLNANSTPRIPQNVRKSAGALSKPVVQNEPVKISLKDCLACSGCITSAETVMLEKQSLDEFLSNLEKGRTVIVSVSPQSRASLAVQYGLSSLQVFRKLTTLFKSLGVKAIFDTSCSRDLTLIESCNEFMVRYKQSQSTGNGESKPPLPMISSACPGWICYAEKTLGSYILPYISSVKSPQQTVGAVVKNYLCQKLSVRPEDIYHVTVMPCYDKKLEAAREDFVFQVDTDSEKITEVDSVLTTGEVLDLIQVNDKSVLKFALCYGFRNLQNVVRKVKMGKCDYHFLEIMACPSGCLNGGGQIKPQPGQSGKELIRLLETAYVEDVVVADPFNNPIIKGLYNEWLEQPGSEKAKRYLHTEYHPVVKSITSQLQNW